MIWSVEIGTNNQYFVIGDRVACQKKIILNT